MDTFLQQLVNGLTLGAVYAVVALGYTMVYGIIQLINFAHGEVVMVGAMVACSMIGLLAAQGWSPWLVLLMATLTAVPACVLLGWLVERVAYRPLRDGPRLAPLITAIGVSIILQHLALLLWTRNPLAFPQLIPNVSYALTATDGGASISAIQLGILLLSLLLMAGLLLLVHRTRLGVAMRATAQNPAVAGLMGVDTHRIIAITFMLGAALAALNPLRRWGWIARREECGTPCQTCRHRCEYQAISPVGKVDYSECFQCLDCVSIYQDPKRCMPLIQQSKSHIPVVAIK